LSRGLYDFLPVPTTLPVTRATAAVAFVVSVEAIAFRFGTLVDDGWAGIDLGGFPLATGFDGHHLPQYGNNSLIVPKWPPGYGVVAVPRIDVCASWLPLGGNVTA
jgi:hypothetical protein